MFRGLRVTNLEERAKLEQLYVCLELHSRICFVWIKFSWPSNIFGVTVAIILSAFVSIRYTGLPYFCYAVYPVTAFALTAIMFWGFLEFIRSVRDSEEILGKLRSKQAPYLRRLPSADRVKVLKRAQAMRAIELPVGEFADLSITVCVTLWEEIVNQVLFLLSL